MTILYFSTIFARMFILQFFIKTFSSVKLINNDEIFYNLLNINRKKEALS